MEARYFQVSHQQRKPHVHTFSQCEGVMNPVTTLPIIQGKRVTGFTTKGEEEEGVLDTIKSWNRPTIEAAAKDCGATYVSPPGPWDSFTVTDGRVVTGANPASAHATAVAAVEAFDNLENHNPEVQGTKQTVADEFPEGRATRGNDS